MKHKLLIVDDNEMMRSFLAHYFSKTYEVKTVAGGTQAWQCLDEGFFPDAILLDYQMPDVSGLALLQQLKTSVFFQDLLVVMISGEAKSQERIACLQAGAADFITKPFNPAELAVRLQYHLKVNRV